MKTKRPKQVLYQKFIAGKVWRVIAFPSGLRRVQVYDGPYFRNATNAELAVTSALAFGPMRLHLI